MLIHVCMLDSEEDGQDLGSSNTSVAKIQRSESGTLVLDKLAIKMQSEKFHTCPGVFENLESGQCLLAVLECSLRCVRIMDLGTGEEIRKINLPGECCMVCLPLYFDGIKGSFPILMLTNAPGSWTKFGLAVVTLSGGVLPFKGTFSYYHSVHGESILYHRYSDSDDDIDRPFSLLDVNTVQARHELSHPGWKDLISSTGRTEPSLARLSCGEVFAVTAKNRCSSYTYVGQPHFGRSLGLVDGKSKREEFIAFPQNSLIGCVGIRGIVVYETAVVKGGKEEEVKIFYHRLL